MKGSQGHDDGRSDRFVGRPPPGAIKEFRFRPRNGAGEPRHSGCSCPEEWTREVRLVTCEDLTVFSPQEGITECAAMRVESGKDKSGKDRVAVSIGRESFNGHIVFRDLAFDAHGTIEAAIRVLRRRFWLKEIARTARGIPMWSLQEEKKNKGFEKRDCFDLFVITHWAEWNVRGILWKERNDLAQKSEVSLGTMSRGAFVRRFQHDLGLRYLRGYIG